MLPITDAISAIMIMKAIGYSEQTRNLLLKTRWYDREGLIHEDELRAYIRVEAYEYLKGYRAFRHTNPVLAASQMRRYLACKEDLK